MHRTLNSNMFAREIEENGSSTENSLGESPPSSGFNDLMIKTGPATSSPKRRRAIQKRVVSIPIKDIEGSRLKGEGPPPSDSWAWRKYGQKPIKGSPYPRGYYRCSSSKGCPARKQVERSRDDPTMLLITYSCEHNHPWPAPRSNHHNSTTTSTAAEKVETPLNQTDRELEPGPEPEVEPEPEAEPETESMREEKFSDISEESAALMSTDVFGWFTGMDTTPSMILESPIFAESSSNSNGKSSARDEADVARFFPLREEDESLFADLGELPECSVVFRHSSSGGMSPQVQIC